jgi:monooxygenase
MKHDQNIASDRKVNAAPLDLLIIGAGLSGICQAWHFQQAFPSKTYAIVEARADLGGTWDLFRYPGIRSDSDMQTLGYSFRPWCGDAAIADGASILRYIRDTAAETGIDRHIRYQHRVLGLSWDSDTALWTVTVQTRLGHDPVPQVQQVTARFVVNCAGYYNHAKGHLPDWPDLARFAGQVIHPQFWPKDFDPSGKRIAVIGSGATAVTLIPELAKAAASVTMLQRSPGYVFAMPRHDRIGNALRRLLGNRWGHRLTRWKNVAFNTASYQLAKRAPALALRVLRAGMRKGFGPGVDLDRHFAPRYAPWDQRICVAPDGDFFATIRNGAAQVITDTITGFTETGIRLASGQVLVCDVIITATGLDMQMGGGIAMLVDGRHVGFEDTFCYKGALYSGLPNFAVAIGYVNASWTLKCELISRYVVRLMQHMHANGWDHATPAAPPPDATPLPTFDLTSGYIMRARHSLPQQTNRGPWKLNQDYILDSVLMTRGRVTDQMIFGRARVIVR